MGGLRMKKIFMLLFFFLIIVSSKICAQNTISQADLLWEKRGDIFNPETLLADSTTINQAISLYQNIIKEGTGFNKEEATWKLIRAYYFKGNYTTHDSELRKKIYDLGKNLGESAIKEFPDSPGVNLFLAIVWGVWGEEYGILAAAKKGVAGKIKDLCEKSIDIDPEFDEAGGYRVLGRVYFKAPKIPLILGWPSKKKAVEILQQALKIAPSNLTTKQFLAEALYSQDQKELAIKLMKEILATQEIMEGVAEDAVIKSEVKATLAEWEK